MEVTYEDVTFEGERDDIIVQLRIAGLTYRQIGRIVGVSRTTVGTTLKRLGKVGSLVSSIALDYTVFEGQSDESVAAQLGMSLNSVRIARRRLELRLRKSKRVELDLRRRRLSKELFSRPPGPNFVLFLDKVLSSTDEMSQLQAGLLKSYYLLGDGGGGQYERYFRSDARKLLKKLVRENPIDYQGQGVVGEKPTSSTESH